MKSICQKLFIEASPETVYDALTQEEGLSGWWTPNTKATPETGSIARFAFGQDYFKEMKITKLEPLSKVEWLCINGYEEWIGTTLMFELQPVNEGTMLFFLHGGWKDYTPEFAGCNHDWALFLRSLRLLCETGKGLPFPHQS